jgi:hypothetical protein
MYVTQLHKHVSQARARDIHAIAATIEAHLAALCCTVTEQFLQHSMYTKSKHPCSVHSLQTCYTICLLCGACTHSHLLCPPAGLLLCSRQNQLLLGAV